MAKNFIQPGKSITVPAPSGGAVSGRVVVAGALHGVAVFSAAEGEPVEISLEGVYELPKVSAQAWTVGAPIYVTSAGAATTVATDNTLIGAAVAVAANPSPAGLVRLSN